MHPIIHGSIVGGIIAFIIAWVIASIPVWLASKAVSKHSSFPRAMLATLGGIIVFAIILAIFTVIGIPILGLLLGFIGVLAVFKTLFETGWGGAFLIAILAFIIVIIINLILAFLGIAAIHFL